MKGRYILLLLIAMIPAIAGATDTMDIVQSSLQTAKTNTLPKLEALSFKWLSGFVMLQFILTQYSGLKKGGEIQDVLLRFGGSLTWFGFCFYTMSNGAIFIDKVAQQMFNIAGEISGTGQFSAAYLIDFGINIAAGLLDAVDKAKGGGVLASLDFLPSIFAGVTSLMILATGALIGFKIFLIKIEVMMIVMLAPVSFSLLGLDALKEQGIAPFKSLISLTYRILLLGVIVSAMSEVGTSINQTFAAVDPGSVSAVWKPIFASLFGFFLLGYLAYSSDRIAANLASGGTSFGISDAATAQAVGAATGSAIGSALGSLAGGASKGTESMADFMKGLGSSGSISNAGARGVGHTPDAAPSRPASMSTAGGAPKRPNSAAGAGGENGPYRLNSAGAPMPPDGASAASSASSDSVRRADTGSATGGAGSNSLAGDGAGTSTATPASGGAPVRPGDGAGTSTTMPASGGAPVRPGDGAGTSTTMPASGGAPVRPSDATAAGIGGTSAPIRPATKMPNGNLSDISRLAAQENATTHISINMNASD